MFISDVDAVTPSRIFISDVDAVTPFNMLNSAAVAVTGVPSICRVLALSCPLVP